MTKGGTTPLRTIAVHSEFGALKAAIVHDASNARSFTMDEQRRLIAPEMLFAHPETGPSSREKLIAQQRALRALLAERGVALLEPEPQAAAPYQVFTRDPSFAIGHTLFVASMRDPWRHAETKGLSGLRAQLGDVVNLSSSRAAIEGGDVMVLDGKVLVGIHHNTDEAGAQALEAAPAMAEHEIVRVPHDALHLDCCVAPLPDGAALIALAKLPESSFRLLQRVFDKLIPLNADEAALHLAANLLWLDAARVVSNAAAVRTNALLRRRGFQVLELDYSEPVALWGGIRCAVCPIERSTTS
jgi:N-dimethylarginine dimethylaminohydrolase